MITHINFSKLKKSEKVLAKNFKNARPYNHVVIEAFFKTTTANKLLSEFPSVSEMQASSAFSGIAEKKNQLSDVTKMKPLFQEVFKELMSKEFRDFISQITGIKPILSDPDLAGGGLHQGENGSFLDIHADFNKHPKSGKFRRLNILIYLNKDWTKNYG